ncbi:BRCT domain-containing protein [Canna indica]|uniref:BRCT domain-containing protein n=1 Tax=Canna indica TaxID=4628 RepID=A0AAQ3KJJ3_9LILI|nr:BRCT domain-containing protein [Canna indica]
MHRSSGASSSSGVPDKIFGGIRFVLFGFDSVSEAQYRSELVRGGGVDAGRYDRSCTHVIVCGRVDDDSVCVAARNDGKILVTESWIDDSLNRGILADATKILYRPVKDLNGIPGSKSLHMCLTGYQRQERDDIMKMVSLMGSKFSKPLIANQVTHLICYKFEGEKYELANKVNIKLVNHRWLEDCLKSWEILPVNNYTISGWELEMLEAEAKDSDEEMEDVGMKSLRHSSIGNSSFGGGILSGDSNLSIQSVGDLRLPKDTVATTHSVVPGNSFTNSTLFRTPSKDNASRKSIPECNLISTIHHHNGEDIAQARDAMIDWDLSNRSNSAMKEASLSAETVSGSSAVGAKSGTKTAAGVKSNSITYSKRPPNNSSPEEPPADAHNSPGLPKENGSKVSHISQLEQKENQASDGSSRLQGLTTQLGSTMEATCSALPQKRKVSVSGRSSKSPKSECQSSIPSALQHPSPYVESREVEVPTRSPQKEELMMDANHPFDNNVLSNSVVKQAAVSKLKSVGYKKKTVSRKLVTGKNSHAVLSSSNANVHKLGVPSPKQGLDEQECIRENLSNTAPEVTDGITSSDGLRDLPLDNGLMQVEDEHEIMKSTGNQFGSSAINELADETIINEGRPEIPVGDLQKPEFASNTLSGETTNISMQNLMVREKFQEEKASLSPNDRLMVIENSSSTVNANSFNDNNPKVTSGAHTKKAVAKRSFNSRSKLNSTNSRKEKDVLNPNKIPMHAEVSGKVDKMEVQENKKVSNKLKSGLVEPLSNDEVMKERMELVSGKVDKMSVQENKKVSNKLKGGLVEPLSNDEVMKERMELMSGKVDKMEVQENKKVSNKLKSGLVEPLSGDEVMKERMEPTECHMPTNTMDDAIMKCKETTLMDSEKENIPLETRRFNSNCSSNRKSKLIKKNEPNQIQGPNNGDKKVRKIKKLNLEPSWFILSGHRIQRKEFQTIIKRLKGRFCRDSHHWSYQATHFIVPDPVRRTEKFFAAAAAGRWILKADYLTASSEAGKFLDEEPFEWHGKGLTEDGAINLEAPRKWRLLRERTGHGALHKMRIIIYGECIAPTLDTLKRVVKAGDGIILATSPPYTRFLKSGVDYAIVSPSMPRVDSWVQEFLRHEIPCVAADYLVEYVCKPGYSLERHVLYKTHSWAEKSFANLLSLSEEIIEGSTPNLEESSEDLSCTVCGSRDRGEVMLICGDEAGTVGCGIGIHIDCCDPPLESIPEGDWFCPKCSSIQNKS